MKVVKVGICGLGTVGKGVYEVLTRNAEVIANRAGISIEVVQIATRSAVTIDVGDIPTGNDILAVASNPDVDIVVELIGGETAAKDLILKAIENGKHVVTANKALIALQGNTIFEAARKKQVAVCYEAAVAGGIPIIKALREGLSANQIQFIAGIINGTGNFILTEMRDKGRDFADVLAEAQELGYAEADPTFDVEGIDAAHKLVILASIAFGIPLQFDKVFTEGISKISTIDVEYAEELGYRIKHLGIASRDERGIEIRVHPTLIPEKRLIANVNGVMNAVMVDGDAVGPTLFYGAGAGAEPTASSVIADIIDIARAIDNDTQHSVPYLGVTQNTLSNEAILPIEATVSGHYLRMTAKDKSGVLSKITQVLGDAGISIEALIQKEPEEGKDTAPIIIITDRVLEQTLLTAIKAIEALGSVEGSVVHIRVESLDN